MFFYLKVHFFSSDFQGDENLHAPLILWFPGTVLAMPKIEAGPTNPY